MAVLSIPAKRLRAEVIAAYVRSTGLPGVICFTCGHAAEELRRQGVQVVEIGPEGELHPARWWSAEEIARTWPHLLDATSGHLPAPLMGAIARRFREHLAELDPEATYEIPTGSGETICCLAWAYPSGRFVAVYDDAEPATRHDPQAPLNGLVRALAASVIRRP